MFNVKVLNQETLEKVLEMPAVIEAIEKVYTLKAEAKADVFPMVFHEFEPGVADMDIKSGYLDGADIFGLKLVSWYGENKDKGLPLLIGTTMIFDMSTGAPTAILNADYITGMRTGAAGAIGAKYLAKKDSKVMLMVGTGHIAQFEIAATLMAVPSIETVWIHDPMDANKSKEYAASIADKLKKNFDLEKAVEFKAVEDFETVVGSSDVIITATPSREAMIKKEWVKPGTHFSCVGSDMSGKQEIDEKLFEVAEVYVDDLNQSVNVGEAEKAIKTGIIKPEDILGEIGEVILGRKVARKSEDAITIFDSTGIALQDLMTAKVALDLAEERGLGVTIDL